MLASCDYAEDPQVRSLVNAAIERFGDKVEAIVLYGSFTRGQTDTLLDLYILLEDLSGRSLPGSACSRTYVVARTSISL